jgi:drug/metabolite transporter (DMT)-like permease
MRRCVHQRPEENLPATRARGPEDRRRLAYAMLSLTALCLAGNHVVGRMVHGFIPPLGLSFWRWMAGALMILPFVLPSIVAKRQIYRDHLRDLSLLGFLIVSSTTAVLVALNFTTAVNVSLINAFQPALTVLLGLIFLGERVSRLGVLGILLALGGVLAMIFEGSLRLLAELKFNNGDLIAIAAMLGFSAYALSLRKRLPVALSPVEALFGITLTGSLMLLPFYALESVVVRPVPVGPQSLAAVLALALLVSVFGNLMWNMGNRLIGPSRAAMFINLIPLFGAILAVIFLNEQIHGYHLVGAAMICAGIWLLVRR